MEDEPPPPGTEISEDSNNIPGVSSTDDVTGTDFDLMLFRFYGQIFLQDKNMNKKEITVAAIHLSTELFASNIGAILIKLNCLEFLHIFIADVKKWIKIVCEFFVILGKLVL